MGYWLLDHHVNLPDGKLPWYTTRRRCQHGIDGPHLITIHTPETLADFTPPYDEAERVAQYGATITRASWHDTIDADSIIPMLPPEFTAWHVRGFNRCGIGMEVGAKATSWGRAPKRWVDGVIANTATRGGQHMDRFGIPPVLLFDPTVRYTSRLDPAGFGLISHHALDPTRRTDPGFSFPWQNLLDRLEDSMVDRATDLGPDPNLAAAYQQYIDDGVFSEYTRPGHLVTADKLAAFGLRERSKVTRKMIAAAVAGVAGGATVPEIIAEIVRRLGNG